MMMTIAIMSLGADPHTFHPTQKCITELHLPASTGLIDLREIEPRATLAQTAGNYIDKEP